jgi:hypothetical protein
MKKKENKIFIKFSSVFPVAPELPTATDQVRDVMATLLSLQKDKFYMVSRGRKISQKFLKIPTPCALL